MVFSMCVLLTTQINVDKHMLCACYSVCVHTQRNTTRLSVELYFIVVVVLFWLCLLLFFVGFFCLFEFGGFCVSVVCLKVGHACRREVTLYKEWRQDLSGN